MPRKQDSHTQAIQPDDYAPDKSSLREEIARLTQQFLARGGKITKVPAGTTGYKSGGKKHIVIAKPNNNSNGGSNNQST